MMGGSIFVSACLVVLAWAAEIVGIFTKDPDSVWRNVERLWTAINGSSLDQLPSYISSCFYDLCGRLLHQCWCVLTRQPILGVM